MSEPDASTKTSPLLLMRGDVESLLSALMLEQEHGSKIRLRHLRSHQPGAQRLEECAQLQAELLEVDLEVVPGSAELPPTILELVDGLLAAGDEEHVVWPVRCGPDAEKVAAAIETAHHLAKACALTETAPQRAVLTPIIDLDAVQALDLAFDLGAPPAAAWPCCDATAKSPCGQCPACSQWREAAKQLGREWPWGELQPTR